MTGDGQADDGAAARFRRADAVLDAALDLEPDERAAYVARACDGDPVLYADVARLLGAHERADGFLAGAAAELVAPLFGTADPAAGTRLGRYELVRPLGRGGMGVVWLARDARLARDVAIKVVREGDTPSARAVREARAAAQLDHPHVAAVYDVGETGDGALWFAMPYCPGGSLAERLRAGPLPVPEAVRVARQLAGALAAAHARGIVHRDVKPANVLFDAAGNVRLADFGIATLAGHDTAHPHEVRGTVAYLAPEQIRGNGGDARADLWSLGVTLYEMLAGYRPFAGGSYGALVHAITKASPGPLPPERGVPPPLAALVARLLTADPAARPGSAAEVGDALAALESAGAPPPAMPSSSHIARPWWSWRARLVAAATLAAALATGFAVTSRRATGAAAAVPAAVRSPAPAASVAVLPFENTGRAAADEPFVDGLTDEVIGTLGRVPGLKVSSRTSAFALRGRGLGVRAMADTLRVATVLEATVRRGGDRLRVSARLVHAADERVLWSEHYDRALRLGDVIAVQQEIANAIVGALRPRLGGGTGALARAPSLAAGTNDLAAYDDYLRARYLRLRRTPEDLRLAVAHFERATARDPAFARAWAGLANTYVLRAVFGGDPPQGAMPRARAAALRALALDSTVAEAHAALGHVRRVYDFDWPGALAASARAMALDPGDEPVRVLHAITLLHLRRYAEAESALEAALAANPLDHAALVTLGRVYARTGRVPRAVDAMRAGLELNPAFAYGHQQLGHVLLQARQPVEALAAFRRAAALSGARDSAHLAYALAVTGQPGEAQRIVGALERSDGVPYLPPFGLAVAHAGLGDPDAAFRWLERSRRERASYLDGVLVIDALDPLAADPRWAPFVRSLGLAP